MESHLDLAGLEVIKYSGDLSGPHVILFHGYGADAFDLAPLHSEIASPSGTNWYFPQGPLNIPIGGGFFGRAWFPINIEDYMRAVQAHTFSAISKTRAPGMDQALNWGLQLLKELNVPMDKLVLGGFSQGAMLATDLALHLPQPPAGLLLFSTTVLDESNWSARAQQHSGTRYYQSHGLADQVLPSEAAENLHRLFQKARWKGNLTLHSGGHEIPHQVVLEAGRFLNKVFAPKPTAPGPTV